MILLRKTLKLFTLLAILCASFLLFASVAGPLLLNLASNAAVFSLDRKLKSKKLGSVKVSFRKVQLKLTGDVVWKGVAVHIISRKDSGDLAIAQGTWRIRQAELVVKDFLKGTFFLKIDGLQFQPKTQISYTKSLLLVNESCLIYSTIPPGVFFSGPRRVWLLLKDFLENGTTVLPLRLSGRVTFLMKGSEILLRFHFIERNKRWALEVDPKDLRQVADLMGDPITNEEVKVMAGNPLKMIEVLRIKTQTRKTAAEICGKISTDLESRCRHVLFSYKLTKAFGQRFAKHLTDAREIGDKDDSYEERVLDDQDSKQGREYALGKYSEKEMLKEVLAKNAEKAPDKDGLAPL